MHIALVNQWYAPRDFGGVAMHNVQFSEACVRLGHEVTVITAQSSNDLPDREKLHGVEVIRVRPASLYKYHRLPVVGRHHRCASALLYSKRVCQILNRLHNEKPVDVAEFSDVNAEGFFWRPHMSRLMAVKCQTPMFVLGQYPEHGVPFDTRLLGWAEKKAIERAAILLAPSRNMAETISQSCKVGIHNFNIIPDALDMNWFKPEHQDKVSDTIEILCVGRLERAKGIEILIEVIPEVCQAISAARFKLIGADRPQPGGGSYRAYIEDRLRAYISTEQVQLLGEISRSELLAAYQAGDITIVPSVSYESFSYTCAQAMACGIPVVASAIGGIPETLGHGACGLLVEPGNISQLSEAIIALCNDQGQRRQLGAVGRKHALEKFRAEVVAQRTVDIYRGYKSESIFTSNVL